MRIQRLSWAGLRIVVGSTIVVVDLLEDVSRLRPIMGDPIGPLASIEGRHTVRLAAITHLHPDHYDPSALGRHLEPSGWVVCHQAVRDTVAADGLQARGLERYDPFSQGDVTLTAVPAIDGFGDPQVSWIVEGGGRRIIHCGDTLWHGHWWRIGRDYGPFDAAFLCINGVVMTYPGLRPSGIAADLTAGQAAAAGQLLDARMVCPIHYGTFNSPLYAEAPDAEPSFEAAARERGVPTQIVPPGGFLEWAETGPPL